MPWVSWSRHLSANVIKLPNISASVPQLVAAVEELQAQGYDAARITPKSRRPTRKKTMRARYDAIKGSAVNPVLREGNSGPPRRHVRSRTTPRRTRIRWVHWSRADSKTKVSSMPGNDFYANEVSATITAAQAGVAKIEFVAKDGAVTVLKDAWPLDEGTVADATFMSAKALSAFLAEAIEDTKKDGTMFSLHMKATMMKVSATRSSLATRSRHGWPRCSNKFGDKRLLTHCGVEPEFGSWVTVLDRDQRRCRDAWRAIEAVIAALDRPAMYMVDSDKGITNLHVPSAT